MLAMSGLQGKYMTACRNKYRQPNAMCLIN
uniref:Uncharacterized protein n=1 Tax=Setaria italica TaxID=4555 RepID=K3ZG47_SETIT